MATPGFIQRIHDRRRDLRERFSDDDRRAGNIAVLILAGVLIGAVAMHFIIEVWVL